MRDLRKRFVIARKCVATNEAIQTNRTLTLSLRDSAMPNRSNPNQTNLNARFVQHYTKILQISHFSFKQNFNFVVAKYVLNFRFKGEENEKVGIIVNCAMCGGLWERLEII